MSSPADLYTAPASAIDYELVRSFVLPDESADNRFRPAVREVHQPGSVTAAAALQERPRSHGNAPSAPPFLLGSVTSAVLNA